MEKKVLARNLTGLLNHYDKTQAEVAKAIGVSPQTFNTWCKGKAYPRPDSVQLLADYFNVRKSEIIEEHSEAAVLENYVDRFARLDDEDRARVMERIDTLLEGEKYDV